jgi:hypothetical protein
MDGAKVEEQGVAVTNFVDAEGNDFRGRAFAFEEGALDFAEDMRRNVRVGGQDEDEDGALGNGLDDGILVDHAVLDVARRHPALNRMPFERPADLLRDLSVFDGVADENVVSHL